MYLLAVFLTIFSISTGQILQQFTENLCASKSTCSDCIRTPSCAWCSDLGINTTKRCFQFAFQPLALAKCSDFQYPNNEVHIDLNSDLTMSSGAAGFGGGVGGGGGMSGSGSGYAGAGAEGSFIQIKPQRVSLKMRARQKEVIKLMYSRADDYPLDLYYLMDLSKSMEDDKEKLSALGDHLAQTMKAMTSKFTLGFGSFVDKVVMPYVSTIPENLISPCPGCKAPYGFRNMMPLSRDTWLFSQMVKDASVSGNLDAPEGGFDAIMQAVVCRREIGWRDQTRRLLVFSTDAGFHYAGDGKLGGIVQPNDAECHLNDKGYYTMSSQQDYPSISQINTYVKKNSINVIFAVTADKIGIYRQLQSHIEGSTCGQLSNDSSNVVELIKEQYNAISETIEMKHNASGDVQIKFFTSCLDPNGAMTETKKCNNVKVGNLIKFDVEIEVLQCPEKREDWKQIIDIHPLGINESLIIDLTMLCDCECEHRGVSYEERSSKCNSKGTLKCGVCDCDKDAYGPHCECSSKNDTLTNVTTINCINKKTGLECSGKGSCVCGKCECDIRANPNERIYGDQCECDNFSCERHNGQICSGPENGICDCGTCACNPGWTGSNCACKDAPDKCTPNKTAISNETTLCSGNGVCECGVCKCNMTSDGPYFGPFCEHNPNKTDDCETYKPCVQCRLYGTGNYTDKECLNKPVCNFHIVEKDTIEVNETNNEILCAFYDENDCRFTFVYYYNETNQIEVRAQKELQCPPIVFLLGIVLGVIGAVILMGLAILLLWKLLTTIHDRREFAKFQKEAMMARWDTGENPIYKQATSTFKNPTYAGKS